MSDESEYHPRLRGTSPLGVIGHQQIIEEFFAANVTRRHHGYIFQGPKGVGKASAAYQLAESIFADEADTALLRAGAHPDALVVEGDPEKANLAIGIDQIRDVMPFLAHTPARGKRRFVLIDALDQMNVNGANALLKSLEEPPEHTTIIIIHHALTPILPTIRSRVQIVRFSPLNFDECRQVIESLYPEADSSWIDDAAVLSEGAPGKAVMLAEAGALDLYTETCRAFAESKVNGLELDRLSSLWGAGGAKNSTRRQLARQFFDRLLVFAAKREGQASMPHYLDIERQAVMQISERCPAYQLAEIRQDLLSGLYEAEMLNLNAAPIIFDALEKMSLPSQI